MGVGFIFQEIKSPAPLSWGFLFLFGGYMMRKLFVVLLMLAVLAGALPACQQPAGPGTDVSSASATDNQASPQAARPLSTTDNKDIAPVYPVTVEDDLGRKITLTKKPVRIISLAPSNTEILFALGLSESIVGVTDYCDYPEAAKEKTRVAGYSTPDLEKLVSLQPDLVVAESIHEKTVLPALERLGVPVYVTWAYRVETILKEISDLGHLTGRTSQAEELINAMNEKINGVVDITGKMTDKQKLRVCYLNWHNPLWTVGANTYINDIISKAGGINIYEKDFEKSRAVSLESIISRNPQIIFVSGMGTAGDVVYKAVKDEVRLYSVDAAINNRIYKISNADYIERPGPRVVEGLIEIAGMIHPEIFKPRQ